MEAMEAQVYPLRLKYLQRAWSKNWAPGIATRYP